MLSISIKLDFKILARDHMHSLMLNCRSTVPEVLTLGNSAKFLKNNENYRHTLIDSHTYLRVLSISAILKSQNILMY